MRNIYVNMWTDPLKSFSKTHKQAASRGNMFFICLSSWKKGRKKRKELCFHLIWIHLWCWQEVDEQVHLNVSTLDHLSVAQFLKLFEKCVFMHTCIHVCISALCVDVYLYARNYIGLYVMQTSVCVCVSTCIRLSGVVGSSFLWTELDAVTQSSESANELVGHVISLRDV